MKDDILESYIDDFASAEGFGELPLPDQLERFANYCIVSKQYPKEFDVEDVSVGGSDDIGADGVAIIVNGNIVRNEEEIDYLIRNNGYLKVSFVFIQSKLSSKFDGSKVGTLLFGVHSFFDEKPSIPENQDIKELRAIKDTIYQNSINFDGSPELWIYYVTTGTWQEPAQIRGRANKELSTIKTKGIFQDVHIEFYDASRLKANYRELRRKIIKEVNFANRVALPDIPKVRQSFVGSIPVTEYISLITDGDGNLQKSLFEDNVRDYQGANKVNADIKTTLDNKDLQAALAILNNGITIIAKKIDPIGNKLKLTDFQIVNGCQSSHVLFEERASLSATTSIVVKFIETTDIELAARIIQATNRQTIVTDEAFESLGPFHRSLEEFYNAHAKKLNSPIYYERRSKQYDGVPSIKPSQVISLAAQINAYVATKLAQPHSTHRYYGELLGSNRKRLFLETDSLEPYFLSGLMLNRLDRAFKSHGLPSHMRRWRYQILYMAHCYNNVLLSRKGGLSFGDVVQLYDSPQKYVPVFEACAELIDRTQQSYRGDRREAMRNREFSRELATHFAAEAARSAGATCAGSPTIRRSGRP